MGRMLDRRTFPHFNPDDQYQNCVFFGHFDDYDRAHKALSEDMENVIPLEYRDRVSFSFSPYRGDGTGYAEDELCRLSWKYS